MIDSTKNSLFWVSLTFDNVRITLIFPSFLKLLFCLLCIFTWFFYHLKFSSLFSFYLKKISIRNFLNCIYIPILVNYWIITVWNHIFLKNSLYYDLAWSYSIRDMIVVFLWTTFWIKLRNFLHSLTDFPKLFFQFHGLYFLLLFLVWDYYLPPDQLIQLFSNFFTNSLFFSSIIFFIYLIFQLIF